MFPPELFTPQEERAIAEMIETNIDEKIIREHSSHEGEKCMACEAGEIMQDDTCNECGCFASAD